MNKRQIAQEMANRANIFGFNRDHAKAVINVFVDIIKKTIRASPRKGKLKIDKLGTFMWCLHNESGWLGGSPRVRIRLEQPDWLENTFFVTCPEKLKKLANKSFLEEPLFVGEEARNIIKESTNAHSGNSSPGRN